MWLRWRFCSAQTTKVIFLPMTNYNAKGLYVSALLLLQIMGFSPAAALPKAAIQHFADCWMSGSAISAGKETDCKPQLTMPHGVPH